MQKCCTVIESSQYQIALPCRSDNPGLPNNWSVALSRLNNLGKRLKADLRTLDKHIAKISEMINLGHAVEVGPDQKRLMERCGTSHISTQRPKSSELFLMPLVNIMAFRLMINFYKAQITLTLYWVYYCVFAFMNVRSLLI